MHFRGLQTSQCSKFELRLPDNMFLIFRHFKKQELGTPFACHEFIPHNSKLFLGGLGFKTLPCAGFQKCCWMNS